MERVGAEGEWKGRVQHFPGRGMSNRLRVCLVTPFLPTTPQAGILQRAIRSLRNVQLATNLGALAAMTPLQLQELLCTQVREGD